MKLLKPLVALVASLVIAATFVARSDGQNAPLKPTEPLTQEGQDGGDKPGGKRHEDSALERNMKTIEHGLKRLRRDAKDATKNEASLATLLDMENAIQACKVLVPPLSAKKPEADRPAFLRDYRKTLIGVEKDLLDAETALLDGDNAKAQECLKKVAQAEDPSHEKFAQDG